MPINKSTAPGIVERVGYASGDFASCLYYNTFSIFLIYFYTDVFGLAPAAVGTMLLVTKFVDNFIDPVVGMACDRTLTRWGRFRPWILFAALPLAVMGVFTFFTPDISTTAKLIYAYVTYEMLMLIYSASNIPYGALLGVITSDTDERTKLSSYRFLGAFSGNFAVQGTLLWLVRHLGHGNERTGFPLAMTVYGVVATLLFFFVFWSTHERVKSLADKQSSIKSDLSDLLHNKPWLVLGLVSVLCLIWISVRNACLIYYFKYYVGQESKVSVFLMTGTLATLVGVALTPRLVKLFGGKKRCYMTMTLISSGSMLVMFFAGPKDYWLMYACQIVGSFVTGPLFPMIWAMYADTADYAEWKFKRRATGLIFSAGTFSQKVGWTVGGAVTGWLLALYGFHANVEQSGSSLIGIRLMVTLIPAATCAATAMATAFYAISPKLEKQIEAELTERRALQMQESTS
jgi:GPH family glycoside/pentoside/hexuronide:cation symporter